jgi:alanine racemase
MHPLIARIRTQHLRHNYLWLKKCHQGSLLAVVKSNAYGHGMVQCAKAIADIVDGFALMYLEEAILLRTQGIYNPILLLEGIINKSDLNDVGHHNIWLTVQSEEQLLALVTSSLSKPLKIWLAMDTGMHRGGIAPSKYQTAYNRLSKHPNISDIVYMTHFACADDTKNAMTTRQIALFEKTCIALPTNPISIAASSAILGHPNTHRGFGRAGIALYGISPLSKKTQHVLKPVMVLSTILFGIHKIESGQAIGYGATFITTRPTIVGIIACGYADGYPRSVTNGTLVKVDNYFCPIIGRPSMNLITVDLTDIPPQKIGTPVELWGDNIDVNTVAASAKTTSYELLCHIKPTQLQWVAS